MWELDHKEGWTTKNRCFRIVVLEKTLDSPLDSKIKPVSPKGNQTWIFIGRTDAEAEAPIVWTPDSKSGHSGEDPDPGKEWRQKILEGGGRGWDGCIASPIQWTWLWANSGKRWRTEEPGMLQATVSQRARHDLATEQQQIDRHTDIETEADIPIHIDTDTDTQT